MKEIPDGNSAGRVQHLRPVPRILDIQVDCGIAISRIIIALGLGGVTYKSGRLIIREEVNDLAAATTRKRRRAIRADRLFDTQGTQHVLCLGTNGVTSLRVTTRTSSVKKRWAAIVASILDKCPNVRCRLTGCRFLPPRHTEQDCATGNPSGTDGISARCRCANRRNHCGGLSSRPYFGAIHLRRNRHGGCPVARRRAAAEREPLASRGD